MTSSYTWKRGASYFIVGTIIGILLEKINVEKEVIFISGIMVILGVIILDRRYLFK